MGSLEQYKVKRDFSKTTEPDVTESGGGQKSKPLALRYAVQYHDATRKHFDLRLEWNGVLLSWAITKGPSFQPEEKRLAVRTEDHPLDYLYFEGIIPEGNYGAGTVMLWDEGHWQPDDPVETGLNKGHLNFRLHGLRLTGSWHLVRMHTKERRENWLLIKSEDEAAGKANPVKRYRRSISTNRTFREIEAESAPVDFSHEGKLPAFRKPQLATLVDDLAEGDNWWHELKFDGYRGLVALGKEGPRIFTRNRNDWTDRFASLVRGFCQFDCTSALIDGEIIAGAGLEGFSALQKAIKAGGPFQYNAFDILELDGKDLTGKPLTERRKKLEAIFKDVPPLGPVQLSLLIEGDAQDSFDAVCNAGGEGLIAKRKDAPYLSRRSRVWLKIKCRNRDEFVIVGWQESDKPARPFASLVLAAQSGGSLTYAGKVGTGFSEDEMDSLAAQMQQMERKTAPVDVPSSEARGCRWITPSLVAEIEYAEFTDENRVRHAVYKGLREDKPAGEVKLKGDRMDGKEDTVGGVTISSPDRIVYPRVGITKLEVARYYEAVAGRMLETCSDRPLSLVRLPTGLEGERFFQKHAGKGFPDAIKSIDIEESSGNSEPYMYVTSAEGLVGAAQMGTLEFHIWGSRIDRLEQPDRMVFDLDPDEGLDWSNVRSAALDMRDRLAALGLPSWPLVTGGKGIHIVVPLRRSAEWETVKLYARLFSQLIAQERPKHFVAEMSKAKRKGRIFIDWLRNERGATAIAPFSLRARDHAPVAVPLDWDEVDTLKAANSFSMKAAQERSWDDASQPAAVSLTLKRIEKLERELGKASG